MRARLLPALALLALLPGAGPGPGRADAAAGAAAWLLANQHADGGWGSHHTARPVEVLCDVPGSHLAFRAATSALGVAALDALPGAGEEVRRAVDRGVAFLLGAADVKRANPLEHYNVWSLGFGLDALGGWLGRHPDDPRAEAVRGCCRRLIARLASHQTLDGGWGYLSLSPVRTHPPSETSMSFTTATILLGLARARDAGVAVPPAMAARAVKCLKDCRTPAGDFVYGNYLIYRPGHGINQDKGAACRAGVCLLALEAWGENVSAQEYEKALADLLVRHVRFQQAGVRRPIPHESWYAVSGYFYLYGHAYAGLVLARLPEAARDRYRDPLVRGVLFCRQPDGSFWDYPLYRYHHAYGTAFALQALTEAGRGAPPGRTL